MIVSGKEVIRERSSVVSWGLKLLFKFFARVLIFIHPFNLFAFKFLVVVLSIV